MSTTPTFQNEPDIKVSVKKVFNIDSEMTVDAFSKKMTTFLKLTIATFLTGKQP